MQFKDVIGQSAVKRRLIEAAKNGRVAHAQLFMGPEGTGKLPLALAYAQYLACPNHVVVDSVDGPMEDSCGQCPACLQYAKLQHPDLHFAFPIVKADSGSVCDDFVSSWRAQLLEKPYFTLQEWYERLGVEAKQGMIYEKESGEILRKLSLKAYGNGYKTMIIWLPEKMNTACANSLLKIIEEPPTGTLFLLVSDQPELLLETIRSRVQQVVVRPDKAEQQMQLAMQDAECAQYFEDFKSIMRNAWAIGQASSLQQKFDSLKDVREWSLKMADSSMGRERQKAFLQYAQRQVRENYIRNYNLPEINLQTADEAAFSQKFAPFIHEGNVEKIMLELDKAEQQIAQNGNAKIVFFDLCLQLIMLIKK